MSIPKGCILIKINNCLMEGFEDEECSVPESNEYADSAGIFFYV